MVDKITGLIEGKGLWYVVFGKTFPESLKEGAITVGNFIVANADMAILPIMIFTFLTMCGAKRFMSYNYWTVIGYVTIKLLGAMLL